MCKIQLNHCTCGLAIIFRLDLLQNTYLWTWLRALLKDGFPKPEQYMWLIWLPALFGQSQFFSESQKYGQGHGNSGFQVYVTNMPSLGLTWLAAYKCRAGGEWWDHKTQTSREHGLQQEQWWYLPGPCPGIKLCCCFAFQKPKPFRAQKTQGSWCDEKGFGRRLDNFISD